MAIRFACQRCGKLLGIASRKAGSEIDCPRCGFRQVVPTEEAAAAALALGHSTPTREVVEDASDVMVYDDQPAVVETPRRPLPEASSRKVPSDFRRAASEDAPEAGDPVPRGMILFRRRTLYVQAVLFVLLAAVAFGSGYFMGRGDATFEESVRRQQAAKMPVSVEGTLTYLPTPDRRVGDEGAVVIALPENARPKTRIAVREIRPERGAPLPGSPAVRAIEELGGAYARTDASGSFLLELPQPGSYWLLLISRSTSRPEGEAIDEVAADEMDRYFQSAAELVGSHKYRWILEEVAAGFHPIEHDFGSGGR